MRTNAAFPILMMAPCGITCAACYAHVRRKNPCPGCRSHEAGRPGYCDRCKIKNCVDSRRIDLCFQCPDFPCASVKHIDKRYRTSYQISLIENGLRARDAGVEQHLREEQTRWTCPECGGVVSLHKKTCSECERNIA